jgi:hypothetical protein
MPKTDAAPARRIWLRLNLAVDENHHVLARELAMPGSERPHYGSDLIQQRQVASWLSSDG